MRRNFWCKNFLGGGKIYNSMFKGRGHALNLILDGTEILLCSLEGWLELLNKKAAVTFLLVGGA